MRKLILLAIAGLFAMPAHADFTGKNAGGTTITFKNPGDCTSVVCVPEQQIVDSTGTAVLGTTTDAVAATPSTASAASLIALMKAINNNVSAAIPDCGATPCTNKIGVVGVNTWAAGVLGAMANYGTSPGAVLAPGVNAFITNTPPVSQSGTWTVQPGNTPNTTAWFTTQNQKFGSAQLSSAAFDIASAGDNIVVTRAVGTIKIYGIDFACATNQTTLSMKNGASTTVGGPYYNVGTYAKAILPEPAWVTTSTNNFIINLSGGTHCGGTVYYLDN